MIKGLRWLKSGGPGWEAYTRPPARGKMLGPRRQARFVMLWLGIVIMAVKWAAPLVEPLTGIKFLADPSSVLAATKPVDPFDDWAVDAMATSLGSAISRAASSASRYASLTQDLNRDILVARRNFWEQYPNGPNLSAARKKFAELLMTKDMLIMTYTVMSGSSMRGGRGQMNGIDLLAKIGGPIDGGIPPLAQRHFATWTDNIRTFMRRGGTQLTSLFQIPERFAAAAVDAGQAYQAYRIARDWAEFTAAGKTPPGVDGPASYVRMVFFLRLTETLFAGDVPPPPDRDLTAEAREQVRQAYEAFSKAFGEGSVREAAQRVMTAPRNSNGDIANTEAFGLIPIRPGMPEDALIPDTLFPALTRSEYRVLIESLALRDPDTYVFGMIADEASGRDLLPWRQTALIKERYDAAYGQQAVRAASEAVRRTSRRFSNGYIKDGRAKYGFVSDKPYTAFRYALAKKDPQGFVRFMIAQRQALNSRQEIDSSYQKLVARYSEPAVLKAAKTMVDYVDLPYERRPPDFPAYRPGNHGEGELVGLIEVLNRRVDLSEPSLVDNPEYRAWSGFRPGAKVVWTMENREGPNRVTGRWDKTDTLLSLNGESALVRSEGTVMRKPDQRNIPAKIHAGRADPRWWLRSTKADTMQNYLSFSEQSGTENLEVGGRVVRCRWILFKAARNPNTYEIKVWLSEEVPGTLVRRWESTTMGQFASILTEQRAVSFTQ
jgi:hypothetical protein